MVHTMMNKMTWREMKLAQQAQQAQPSTMEAIAAQVPMERRGKRFKRPKIYVGKCWTKTVFKKPAGKGPKVKLQYRCCIVAIDSKGRPKVQCGRIYGLQGR